MRTTLFLTLCSVVLLPGVPTVMADDAPKAAIEVKLSAIEYGLFNVSRTEKVGSRLPVYETMDYLNTTTDQVVLEKNLAFGSRFRVDADRGRMLQFLTVWSMPPMDVPGRKEPVRRKSTLAKVRNHEVYKSTYRLDEPWEMQPGEWTLQVFLVGVDKDNVRKVADLTKSPYWIEVYKKTFTLKPASEAEGTT